MMLNLAISFVESFTTVYVEQVKPTYVSKQPIPAPICLTRVGRTQPTAALVAYDKHVAAVDTTPPITQLCHKYLDMGYSNTWQEHTDMGLMHLGLHLTI